MSVIVFYISIFYILFYIFNNISQIAGLYIDINSSLAAYRACSSRRAARLTVIFCILISIISIFIGMIRSSHTAADNPGSYRFTGNADIRIFLYFSCSSTALDGIIYIYGNSAKCRIGRSIVLAFIQSPCRIAGYSHTAAGNKSTKSIFDRNIRAAADRTCSRAAQRSHSRTAAS